MFRACCHGLCLELVRNLTDQYGNVDAGTDPTAGDCFLTHVNVLTYLHVRLTKQCLSVATVRSIHAALGANQDVVVGKTNSSFLTNTHVVSSDILLRVPPATLPV